MLFKITSKVYLRDVDSSLHVVKMQSARGEGKPYSVQCICRYALADSAPNHARPFSTSRNIFQRLLGSRKCCLHTTILVTYIAGNILSILDSTHVPSLNYYFFLYYTYFYFPSFTL